LLVVSCQLAQSLTRANYTTRYHARGDTRPALHLCMVLRGTQSTRIGLTVLCKGAVSEKTADRSYPF
ncbi:hypothetical protein GBAR_LOCUS6312, partial [Geodia barretti]